jgi:hypothetical protein
MSPQFLPTMVVRWCVLGVLLCARVVDIRPATAAVQPARPPPVVTRLALRQNLRGGGSGVGGARHKRERRKGVARAAARGGSQNDDLANISRDAAPADTADDDANFDSWLAGWQKGGGGEAVKRKSADAADGKTRRTSDGDGEKARDSGAGTSKGTDGSDVNRGTGGRNGGDSEEDFEAMMQRATKVQVGETADGEDASSGKDTGKEKRLSKKKEKSRMQAEKWPEVQKKRKKTEAELIQEDAEFLNKVRRLEEEAGGAHGLFTRANITQDFTIPDYDTLMPSIQPPTQYRFNRSEWMAEPAHYDWDSHRCQYDTVYNPFPKNHTLITRQNSISVRVETHPRRLDQVHVRPTAPDVYYALNHELLEHPRGVRWEVTVTGLSRNTTIRQLREVLGKARETDSEYKRERERRRKSIERDLKNDVGTSLGAGGGGFLEEDVQHISLFHGECENELHTYMYIHTYMHTYVHTCTYS